MLILLPLLNVISIIDGSIYFIDCLIPTPLDVVVDLPPTDDDVVLYVYTSIYAINYPPLNIQVSVYSLFLSTPPTPTPVFLATLKSIPATTLTLTLTLISGLPNAH